MSETTIKTCAYLAQAGLQKLLQGGFTCDRSMSLKQSAKL